MFLDEWMAREGMTHAKFATLVNISRPTVTRWLRGDRTPSPRNLKKITELTQGQVTANDFVAAHPDKEGAAHG